MHRQRTRLAALLLWTMTPGALGFAGSMFFHGLGDLPGGDFGSSPWDVSDAGDRVVGRGTSTGYFNEAFLWTSESGMTGLGDFDGGDAGSDARGISADGALVVGVAMDGNDGLAFRWSKDHGMQSLGDLPGGERLSVASDVSGDGAVVVGYSHSVRGTTEGFRWTANGGMKALPYWSRKSTYAYQANSVSDDGVSIVGTAKSGDAFRWSVDGGYDEIAPFENSFPPSPWGISADGNVVVGYASNKKRGHATAFRWTPAGGIEELGALVEGKWGSTALDVSADGAIIVGDAIGTRSHQAFIWDATNGMRDLQSLLEDEYQLDLTGWLLDSAYSISGDGTTIVGVGSNPDHHTEAWIARIPEPASSLLVVLGGVFVARRFRR